MTEDDLDGFIKLALVLLFCFLIAKGATYEHCWSDAARTDWICGEDYLP